jgi:hypothetical protein
MENDVDKKLAEPYFPRFGKIAIDMGFVTVKQLKEAIIEQIDDDIADKPHRPIGKILLENSWITKEQIAFVLNELFKGHD